MKNSALMSFIAMWLSMAGLASAADCWELTDREGQQLQVSDIWHLKNRFGGGGVLMAEMDGEELSIPVEDIHAVTMEPVKEGRLSFLSGGGVTGEITFANGSTGRFETEQNLFYLKDGRKGSMSIADVQSIVRCTASTATQQTDSPDRPVATPVPVQPAVSTDVDSIYLANGDVLYGIVSTVDFNWSAPYAALVFKQDQIKRISLPREGDSKGLIELRSGDRLSGRLDNTSVEMVLQYGQRVPLATGMIESIQFRAVSE